jgi:hypothetical protein
MALAVLVAALIVQKGNDAPLYNKPQPLAPTTGASPTLSGGGSRGNG